MLAKTLVQLALRHLRSWANQPWSVGPEVERDPPVVASQRAAPCPDDFAHGDQLVEQLWAVIADADRQDVPLEHRCRDGGALQLEDDFGQPIEPPGVAADAVPAGEEPRQGFDWDRLDLATEGSE